MADLVETLLSWFPLVALGVLLMFLLRPINIAVFLIRRALRKGEEERAMAIATRYARLRPRDPKSWLTWAWLVDRQGVRWGSAGPLREGFERNPESLELGVAFAKALITTGEDADAYELIQEIRSRHPKAPEPIVLLAHLASMADNRSETRRLISEGRHLIDPGKHASQVFELAYLLVLMGELDEAKEFLEAFEERLNEGPPHLLLALLKERTDPAHARRHLAIARYYWQGSRTEMAHYFEQTRDLIS